MRKISLIVIHCSATRVDRDFTAKDVDTAHRYRGFSCWGYHYYIRKSGEVEPMRDEDTAGTGKNMAGAVSAAGGGGRSLERGRTVLSARNSNPGRSLISRIRGG